MKPRCFRGIGNILSLSSVTACVHFHVYFSLISMLVSHGFIVAAPEHADGSAIVSQTVSREGIALLPHSHLTPAEAVSSDLDCLKRQQQLRRRVLECKRVLDNLLDANSTPGAHSVLGSFLQGSVDGDCIGVAGHSFGAATAVQLHHEDQRVKASVALDLWMHPFRNAPLPQPPGPVLVHVAQVWQEWLENFGPLKSFFGRLPATSRLIVLRNSGHLNYCDFALHASKVLRLIRHVGTIKPDLGLRLVTQHALHFLQANLAVPIEGVSSLSPAAFDKRHCYMETPQGPP
eukprot:m.150301 g.150301  ORF g.150301 m.150301 type:complete len:289 (+) comp52795_c0_seq7:564-1430(+)